jgi:GNAT superfamily N-acetyltransferase
MATPGEPMTDRPRVADAPPGITLRRAIPDDTDACHRVMWHAITDLARRHGMPMEGTADDWRESSEPQFSYLSHAAAEWWVAEETATGAIAGYARSIERGGLLELTEFFVHPARQAKGVGRALLGRALPPGRGEVRSIIATTDVSALARYYAAGTVARFPLLTLAGAPAAAAAPDGLHAVPVDVEASAQLAEVAAIERAVLAYPRGEAELRWILGRREGYLYRRGGVATGYAFVGRDGAGPIAALEAEELVAQLLHVESRAQALGVDRLSLQVPGLNAVAVRHLVARGFRIDPWVNLLMSNRPNGRFDRFVAFSPVFL